MIDSWLKPAAFSLAIAFFLPAAAEGASSDGIRISGPLVHDNLAVYLLHGTSKPGPVPIVLQEAIEKKLARVSEIGRVNELVVENISDRDLFIQSGDIVTGGRQDRVFVSSLILPPHSGPMTLAVFCVEPGRWTGRIGTNDGQFVAAVSAIPSPMARNILAEAAKDPDHIEDHSGANLQLRMWAEAAAVQSNLGNNLGASALDPASPTSLALSLQGAKLEAAEKAYVEALGPLGLRDDDVVGYVLVVNGHMSKAEIYASHALFHAMWLKDLRAGAAEAIETETKNKAPPLTVASVESLLDTNSFGPVQEKPVANMIDVVRDSPRTLFVETRRADHSWILRSYIAKAQP
jgi:hypothetical protein